MTATIFFDRAVFWRFSQWSSLGVDRSGTHLDLHARFFWLDFMYRCWPHWGKGAAPYLIARTSRMRKGNGQQAVELASI